VAATILAVAVALLAFEAWHYFSPPPLDAGQIALAAWQGVRAPDFSVITFDGNRIRLADLKGRRVILNFWATWCPPCLEELPNFIKLRSETSPANLVIIGLGTDDPTTLMTFAPRNGINYPLALLQNMPSPYRDVDRIPVTFVIDRNGVIQFVRFGPQDLAALKRLATRSDFTGKVKPAPVAPQ
jgi:thiol-disulfide isomerase/thioredoxin